MASTRTVRDHEKPHDNAPHSEDIGEVENSKPRHSQIVDDLTGERCLLRRPKHPVNDISQASRKHHGKENSIHHFTTPNLDSDPSGQSCKHANEDYCHDRAETRTHTEGDTRVEDQPQIKRRKHSNDATTRQITERPLLHELIDGHTDHYHQKNGQSADSAAAGKIGSYITHPTTIQNFLNYLPYPVLMTTKWSASALTARLRLHRALATTSNNSAAASTKLRLIDITDQVDTGALPTELAEELLIGLTDRLEQQGKHQ